LLSQIAHAAQELSSGLSRLDALSHRLGVCATCRVDYTVHVVVGVDPENRMYLLDLWRGQTSSDLWIEAWCDLVRQWKPAFWAEERGQIISGVGVGGKQRLESDQANRPEPHRHVSRGQQRRRGDVTGRPRAADWQAPTLQAAKARFRTNWSRCRTVGPRGEPSSLGTSRYLIGCRMCTVPDRRGRAICDGAHVVPPIDKPHCSACGDEMELSLLIPPFGSSYGLKVFTCPRCGRSSDYLIGRLEAA
jgi:hypothetical protein